jgi:hypothetical protein
MLAERPGGSLRGLLGGELDVAIEVLGDPDFRRKAHEVRRSLKKARALLRLLRASFGDAQYHRENEGLRDAGRSLARVRNAESLHEAYQSLASRANGRGMPRRIAQLLRQELERARLELSAEEASRDVHALRLLKRRLDEHALPSVAQGARRGLARTYKKGRIAMESAPRFSSDARLHEWRKQVKYLVNELDALPAALRRRLGARQVKRLNKLAELLGDDHDLAMLHRKLAERLRTTGERREAKALRRLDRRLLRRRESLQAKSRRLGKRLYRRRPRRFAERAAG